MGKLADTELIIVGGGIGGLTIALGAAKAGKKVTVFESASEFGEIGAGQKVKSRLSYYSYLVNHAFMVLVFLPEMKGQNF